VGEPCATAKRAVTWQRQDRPNRRRRAGGAGSVTRATATQGYRPHGRRHRVRCREVAPTLPRRRTLADRRDPHCLRSITAPDGCRPFGVRSAARPGARPMSRARGRGPCTYYPGQYPRVDRTHRRQPHKNAARRDYDGASADLDYTPAAIAIDPGDATFPTPSRPARDANDVPDPAGADWCLHRSSYDYDAANAGREDAHHRSRPRTIHLRPREPQRVWSAQSTTGRVASVRA
jgi:hypothetical protein